MWRRSVNELRVREISCPSFLPVLHMTFPSAPFQTLPHPGSMGMQMNLFAFWDVLSWFVSRVHGAHACRLDIPEDGVSWHAQLTAWSPCQDAAFSTEKHDITRKSGLRFHDYGGKVLGMLLLFNLNKNILWRKKLSSHRRKGTAVTLGDCGENKEGKSEMREQSWKMLLPRNFHFLQDPKELDLTPFSFGFVIFNKGLFFLIN